MAIRTPTYSAHMATRDDETDPNMSYFGTAEVGTLDSEPKWSIKRYRVVAGVVIGECAVVDDIHKTHIHKWTDRATLEYK